MKSATKNQKKILAIGLNCILLTLAVCTCGIANNTNKDANKAITPNNLSGIDLRIA
jgi:hypothetical protein